MNIAALLEAHELTEVDLDDVVAVQPTSTACETVAAMKAARTSCAAVQSSDALLGVFTQSDATRRVANRPATWAQPVSEVMTPDPRGLSMQASIVEALHLMNEEHIRHVLAFRDEATIAGVVSDVVLVKIIDRLLIESGARDEHRLAAQHGLLFVDFTGLPLAKPVTVLDDVSVARAIHEMTTHGIGSVLVVDARGSLRGIVTEGDVMEVMCEHEDLAQLAVEDWMTADPVTLSPRDMISDGFAAMANHGFSHLPLVAETGRPVGIVSFRDLAHYLEVNILALQ